MGLSATVTSAVDAAFKAAGDLVDTKAVFRPSEGSQTTFNPITETRSGNPPPTQSPVRVLITETKHSKVDDVSQVSKTMATPAQDYGTRKPRSGDAVETSDGRVWRLGEMTTPPGSALLKLFCTLESES